MLVAYQGQAAGPVQHSPAAETKRARCCLPTDAMLWMRDKESAAGCPGLREVMAAD